VGKYPVNKRDTTGMACANSTANTAEENATNDCGNADPIMAQAPTANSNNDDRGTAVGSIESGQAPRTPQSEKPSTLEKLGRCTSDQLGLGELAEAAAVAAGQPIPGTKRFVTPGSSRGTSAAGMAADRVLGKTRLPTRLPTVVGGPGTGRALAIATTKSAARFAGRAVPIVGWALLAYHAASIAICTASDD